MKLAKVIGRVVLSRKDKALPNGFLAILSPLGRAEIRAGGASAGSGFCAVAFDRASAGSGFCAVAFDPHGAAAGDTVAYVEGAEASAPFDSPAPVDAYCAGIVEKINIYNDK